MGGVKDRAGVALQLHLRGESVCIDIDGLSSPSQDAGIFISKSPSRATAVQLQYHCTTVTRLCTQVFLVFQCSLAVPQYICYLDWLALLASLKTATANGKVTPGACNCTTVTLLYLFCFTGLVCIQESNAIVMIISCNFIVANVGFTEGRKPFLLLSLPILGCCDVPMVLYHSRKRPAPFPSPHCGAQVP